ncbi:alpha/beta hydrolase [soil metagenome]
MAASFSDGAAGVAPLPRAGEYFMLAGGVRLWVERCGSGPPLVLVPGLGAGTWLWDEVADTLAARFTLIMPELRGSGRSDKPDERYTIQGFATDVIELLDRLGIASYHLLGASMGGFVAQHIAAQSPARVQRLVLAATTSGGAAQIGPTGDVLTRLIRPHGRTRRERFEDAYELGFTGAFRLARRDLLDRITALRLAHPQPEFAYYRQLLAGHAWDGVADVRRIVAPTLICTGAADVVVPPANGTALEATLQDARLVVFPGAHMFFLENGAAFARAVGDFLTESAP